MKKQLLALFSCALCSFASEHQNHLFFSPEMISSHIKEYSIQEKEAILKDLSVVRSVCAPLKNPSSVKPLYVSTAGAPGARKTTILERFLTTYLLSPDLTYLDPDQRALKFMAHTYYSQSLSAYQIAEEENYTKAIQNAYEKWRGASNFITLTLLEEAFAKRQSIAYGATSTGGHIPAFLSKVKDAGYEIILLLCSAEDAFRGKAIEYRNTEQKFYQSTPEDAISKGKVFPLRMESYFTYADSLYIFWSDELFEKERLAAIFSEGSFKVIDPQALERFTLQFETDRNALEKEGLIIPSWDQMIKIYQDRFLTNSEI